MNKIKSIVAKAVKSTAKIALVDDANKTTCLVIYQPEVPAKLDEYKHFWYDISLSGICCQKATAWRHNRNGWQGNICICLFMIFHMRSFCFFQFSWELYWRYFLNLFFFYSVVHCKRFCRGNTCQVRKDVYFPYHSNYYY